MTSYIRFAGLGVLISVGLAYAEAASSGSGSAFFAFLSNLLATLFLVGAYQLLREQPTKLTVPVPREDGSRTRSSSGRVTISLPRRENPVMR